MIYKFDNFDMDRSDDVDINLFNLNKSYTSIINDNNCFCLKYSPATIIRFKLYLNFLNHHPKYLKYSHLI